MFRYIKLKNYKSLVDFEVDLTNKKGVPKKFVLVYGENGVGKTNLASAFNTMLDMLRTKVASDWVSRYMEMEPEERRNDPKFQHSLALNFKSIETIIKETKTINSEDNMEFEFGFRINNKNGAYRIVLDNTKIIEEKLIDESDLKNKIEFSIDENKCYLSDGLFKDLRYKKDIDDLLDKYWGKHSLFSLIFFENADKRTDYIKERLNKHFFQILTFFVTLGVRLTRHENPNQDTFGTHYQIMTSLERGNIPTAYISQLKKAEKMLNMFFTNLYSDIKQVYYETEEMNNNYTKYNLMFKKLIQNKIVDVKYTNESAGTKCLVDLIPFFMSSMEGNFLAIDEIDTKIHDILISTILESFFESAKNQVIITTHNTLLLENEKLRANAFVFKVDKNGCKKLLPITDFEERIHPNLNIRKRYLNGLYGGIPFVGEVDFDELLEIMEE